ncbi:glycosyltransferase [Streptococcus sp. 20925_1_24]|uniref:glycosyltransferase family 2 protein n=1 Tax=Streptococcus sp. 20925_1_24 TaxID=3003662 RepID=UPI0021B59541
MDELISIIVPIYNVEEYLRECLDSIQKQTYPNFECIMVNDGSTDNSKQIAEEYLVDSRFTLINQSNQGLSSARNTGISHIREESTFISFVDSDDYIYPDFLETLIEHIEDDVDIIEGMIEFFHDEIKVDNVSHNFEKKILISKDSKLGELALNELRVNVFPKLFRKSLLTEDFFPKGWIFEDLAVVPELVSHSGKWIKLPKVIYGYRIRPNSITTKEFSEEKLDIFKILEKFDSYFKDESDVTKLLVEKIKYLHLNYHDIEFVPENSQYKQLYKKEKQKILSKIADYENKALISIIVPIYNVEEYLRECLDSIQKQTYQKFECIMVNDGSTDNSKQIAEEYLVDSRFKLINQSNQGLSSARNTGIKHLSANSSFVSFVDSDDYIHSTFLEKMTAQIEEGVDIIEGLFEHYHDGNIYYFPQSEPHKVALETTVEKLKCLALEKIRNSSCGKLIRREMLHGSFFPEGWIFEDLAVVPEFVTSSNKWVKIQETVYTYRIRENSIITSSFSEKDLDIFKIFEKFDYFFKDESRNIKIWVEKLKLLHINYRSEKVPTQYIERYQKEKEKILSQIEEYEKGELISIIVPIYNVENYLRHCLESIQNQTYQNFECLLINDGSSDNSAEICREYVEKDSRFRYFEKENGGVSSARNLGIERSKGQYITFIDSDDWVDSDYLELLYMKINEYNADLAVLTYKQYSMNDGCFYLHVWEQDYYEKYYTGNELLNSLPNLENYDSTFNVSWGKLFKRNFLETATFNEQRIMGEDLEFNFKIFLQIKSCIYLNKALYNFRQHHLSTRARKISDKYLMDNVEIRLGRLPFLIGKTVDTNLYLAKTKEFLKYHIDNEVEFGIDNTNAIQLYKEIFHNL